MKQGQNRYQFQRYKDLRPTEVETLLGDYCKARQKQGWMPKISTQEMCREMVAHDLKRHGYQECIETE